MSDNDILIARKTEGGCRSVVIDGDTADFARQNRRVKERAEAEEAKRKAEIELARIRKMEKEAAEKAEYEKRRKQVRMLSVLVLSVGALMAMTMGGLMDQVVGMVFIAGDAAVCGYFAK